MSNPEQVFLKIKKKIESLQQESERAKGAMAQIQKQLAEQFGCTDLKKAVQLLETMQKEESGLLEQLAVHIDDFKEKYGTLLEDNSD